jgi:hypothetical protein
MRLRRWIAFVIVIPGIMSIERSTLAGQNQTESWSPAWTKDLVIYEVAPKGFTSPRGPQTGTFETLRSRLSYLRVVGITGIWLAGYALADAHHFFNIWMCYASIDPAQIEPSLGTPAQFKALIDEAHRQGIRVFLDVTTHGLMADSPVVQAHPAWFRGGSWGMVDFDWGGGHTDLDDWWERVWTDYVTKYAVDGFRLDLGFSGRPDIWARVRRNAEKLGHPIVIFEEQASGTVPGLTDFTEMENAIFVQTPSTDDDVAATSWGASPNPLLADNIPGFYDRRFGRVGHYHVVIQYFDGTIAEGDTHKDGPITVRLKGLDGDKVSRRYGDATKLGVQGQQAPTMPPGVREADGIPDVALSVSGVAEKKIANFVVSDDTGNRWALHGWRPGAMDGTPPILNIYVSTLSYGSSIALSIHDIGSFRVSPENPYTARGSRALFGYSFLFTPMIPIFFSGEEFNAEFHATPWMSPDLYGAHDPGQGRMLYSTMIDWSELAQPEHEAMLRDVTRMLDIRRAERNILTTETRGDIVPNPVGIPFSSDISVPIPYFRWNGHAGVVIAANRNSAEDAHIRLKIPVGILGGMAGGQYRVTDLWNGGAHQTVSAVTLDSLEITVRRDKTPYGGIGVLKIEAAPRQRKGWHTVTEGAKSHR